MDRYLVRRIFFLVVTLWAIVTLAFLAIHLVPGNVTAFLLQEQTSPARVAALKKALGLDRPLWDQYRLWLTGLAHGNLGTSFVTDRPVTSDILQRLPVTAELAAAGMLISLLIAVPAGVLSAAKRKNIVLDYGARLFALVGVSIPSFWLGLLLVGFFAVDLGWLPSSGWVTPGQSLGENLQHLALPAATLGVVLAGSVMRMLRASMLEAMQQDYIRVARAKGLRERVVVWKHALRNALVPSITLVGLQIGYLLGGTVVIEQVFSLPGVGRYLLSGIFERDYPVVQSMILVYGFTFMAINLLVDVTYGFADPRVR
jgi:peptide/nickel transport system permease protein